MSHQKHWENDALDRHQDSLFLIDFLKRRHGERKKSGIKGAYVLNVNAEWGFGKTYFLRGMAKDLHDEHPVVMIDAWKNDFSDDPYTMVISEIDTTVSLLIPKAEVEEAAVAKQTLRILKQNAGQIILAGTKGATKKLVTKLIGDGFDEIAKLVTEKDNSTVQPEEKSTVSQAVDAGIDAFTQGVGEVSGELLDALATRMINDYQEVKRSQDKFRASLSELLKAIDKISKVDMPMFVFIDELDRCRPTYAISLLERVKHLFDVDDIVFVVATDTKQLGHSISGHYGSGFDGQEYLHRFFTRTYTLPKPTTNRFIEAMVTAAAVDVTKWHAIGMAGEEISFLAEISNRLGSGLREIQRAMEILFDLSTSWKNSFPIELCVMYPLIVGYLRAKDTQAEQLQAWMADVLKWTSEWKAGKVYVDRFEDRRVEPPAMSDLISIMWESRNEDFYEYQQSIGRSGRGSHNELAFETLSREYHARFQNLVHTGKTSTIGTYLQLIRYAGNFS
jgi:hypothetical protein